MTSFVEAITDGGNLQSRITVDPTYAGDSVCAA